MAQSSVESLSRVEGAFVVAGQRYHDHRGYFQELHNVVKSPKEVQSCQQVSVSQSRKGVFRGIHTSAYYKLIACLKGRILDIIVDLRESSPTYLNYVTNDLKESESRQVYVPPGCGHAFLALEDSIVCYTQGGTFNPPEEMDVNYKDPQIGLKISEMEQLELIISDKDRDSPTLADARRLWRERHK